jgi:hypothetical protein
VWEHFAKGGIQPLVVDLRPFRSIPEKERVRDPEYLSHVATIAAKILGTDKEAIWGQYYRAQKIRTTFLAFVAIALFALLAAIGFVLRNESLAKAREQNERLLGLAREGILYLEEGRPADAKQALLAADKGLSNPIPPPWISLAVWEMFRRYPPPLVEYEPPTAGTRQRAVENAAWLAPDGPVSCRSAQAERSNSGM